MTDYLSRWNEYAAAKAALEETTTQLGEGRAQLEALQEKVGQHTTESVTLEDQLKEALATEIASHKEATAAREGKLVEATKALKAGKLEEAYSLLEDSPLCAPFQPTITVQAIKKMVYGIDLERREVVWERPSSDYACRRVWEVVQDDELACVTDGENFAALNKKDGEMVGVSPDGPNQYVRSMQLADGKLVVAQSRHILTLDREGNELWRSDSCERFHELVADDNRVYASGWERITAFDLTYGKTLWKEGNFDCCQQLAVAGETLYVESFRGPLAAFDAATGKEKWLKRVPFGSDGMIADEQTVYLLGKSGVSAYHADSGEEVWSWQAEGRPVDLTLGSDTLYVGFWGGNPVLALDTRTGEERWQADIGRNDPWRMSEEHGVLTVPTGRYVGGSFPFIPPAWGERETYHLDAKSGERIEIKGL